MCVALFPGSLRELVFWGWWKVYLSSLLFCICSINPWEIVLRCGGQLLNFISASCAPGVFYGQALPWSEFIAVSLGLVCWTSLIANSHHCVSSELKFASSRVRISGAVAAANPLEFGVARCRTSQFARYFLPVQVRMWNDQFPTLYLTPERWMGPRVQSTVGCFPELCVLQFTVAQVLVGLRKQFINNFVFSILGQCCWF